MTLVGNYFGDLHLRESTAVVAASESEILKTASEHADELTQGMEALRKAVPAGTSPLKGASKVGAGSFARACAGRLETWAQRILTGGLCDFLMQSRKHFAATAEGRKSKEKMELCQPA